MTTDLEKEREQPSDDLTYNEISAIWIKNQNNNDEMHLIQTFARDIVAAYQAKQKYALGRSKAEYTRIFNMGKAAAIPPNCIVLPIVIAEKALDYIDSFFLEGGCSGGPGTEVYDNIAKRIKQVREDPS